MKAIDKILQKLEDCIVNDTFQAVETELIELKPSPANPKGAKSLYHSICAFLNTNGGIVIIGIEEKQNPPAYFLRGYNEDFENNIKETIAKSFTDAQNNIINTTEFVNFQIKDFLNERILVLYIDKLPDENKFVYFDKIAYQRKLTGDHKVSEDDIKRQIEIIEEIINARELFPVENATLNDLDVDKLNEYIQLLNKETKVETFKADIPAALPFMTRKRFVIDEKITTLGMLVCGNHPEDFIGNRCQVDGFVDSEVQIVQDKKVYQDNVLPLMEKSVAYIYKNIQVGVSFENAGSKAPEYPDKLIRECVNNAIAHRDYSIDKYINITIKPNTHIEIRNPGSFKKLLLIEETTHALPIRRIIPDSKPRNPKLAAILKVFDKWEGKGIGMATLTNIALENQIDLPYYRFYSEDDLGLFIPKGRLFDEKMAFMFEMYDFFIENSLGGELNQEQKIVLSYFYKSEKANRRYRYTILLSLDNNHYKAIETLEKSGLIFKHELSHKLYPVYFVNREFLKDSEDFYQELRIKFGKFFDVLSHDYKITLVQILKSNKYSKKRVISANQTALNLYYSGGVKLENNSKKLDDFKRKIRNIINKLEEGNFIIRDNEKPFYYVNSDFKLGAFQQSMFDSTF
jgi:ATP-dependent DNA helicase RecG